MRMRKLAVIVGGVAGIVGSIALKGDAQTLRDQCYHRQGEPPSACTKCVREDCFTNRCCLIIADDNG